MLTVIGAITLFFVGKFIYDTYITNNTEENWQQFQKSNPEEAARLERNEGLNFNTKPITKEKDRIASYIMLANHLKCKPENVKEVYINDLRKKMTVSPDVLKLARQWKNKKYEESKSLNFDPDDTPASLLETWTMSVFNELQHSEILLNKHNYEDNKENEHNQEDEDEEEYDDDDDEDDVENEYDDEDNEENEYDEETNSYSIERQEVEPSGLYNIKVKNSRWDAVTDAFGLPDEIKNHSKFSTEMIYIEHGLSFYFKAGDINKTIVVIQISKNFKRYFPKIKAINDKNISLHTVIEAYGEGSMNSYSTSNKKWIGLEYYPNIQFKGEEYEEYSEYSEYDDSDSMRLASVQIGAFN